jgi:hypothetical protein
MATKQITVELDQLTTDPVSPPDGSVWYNITENVLKVCRNGAITVVRAVKDNRTATTDPGATDDSGSDYEVGSHWINVTLDKAFVCVDDTAAAAVWIETTTAGTGAVRQHLFYGDQLDFPLDADWDISAAAAGSVDALNAALVVRRFDDTTQEAVGFPLSVDSGIINMTIREVSRAQVGPTGSKSVARTLHYREIPDNGAVGAWSQFDLDDISIPNGSTNFQYDEQTIALATLGVTAGSFYQWELSRDTGDVGDTLSGDWSLLELRVRFS